MVLLQLVCLRLGEGGEASIAIDSSWTALSLKNKILEQLFKTSEEILAPELRLFLARTTVGGGYLAAVERPSRGPAAEWRDPQEVERLYMKDEIVDPADALSSILPKRFPKTGTIHVLVKVSVKRRRLENAEPLVEVPHIDIQGAEYVTLPGEFVAECGLYPGGDLMLYCLPQVHELWEFLRQKVVAQNKRGWVMGPPGTGKSACTLSFAASLDPEEWNVVWIHIGRKVTSCCVVMGSKQYGELGDLTTFQLPRVDGEKRFVCVDGFNEDVSKTPFLPNIGASLHKDDRLVICSSMATVGKTNDNDDSRFRLSYFVMYSWTQDEYINAIADASFYEKVADKLDTPSDWEANDNEGNDDEAQLSDKDQKMRALQRKFFFAGGSCRFMFEYSTSRVEAKLRNAVNSATNKLELVQNCTGVFHSDTVHTLYGMQRDSAVDAGRHPVSSFAASLCAQQCGEQVISELASRLNASKNPSVDGHLFEWLFLAAVPQQSVKLTGADKVMDVLPRANIFQFDPKKKFKTLPAEKKKGEISGKHEGNKYDVTYEDGEKEERIDVCFIWLLGVKTGRPQGEFEVGDRVRVEIPDIRASRSWLQPVAWNQGGYDAVYFDTKANQVIFIQLTRSDKHTFKMRFFKEVLIKLRTAGLRNPDVEVYFVVKPHQLMTFSINEIDDRGANEEFDERWAGTEEDHVKVRAFESNTG